MEWNDSWNEHILTEGGTWTHSLVCVCMQAAVHF